MNSFGYQSICLVCLILCVLWNRAGWGDPRWPLVGIGLALFVWLILGVSMLMSSLWAAESTGILRGMVSSWHSMAAVAAALIPMILLLLILVKGLRVPPIHDISTDLIEPPPFVLATTARHPSHNTTEYVSDFISDQRRAYPHIAPLTIALSRREAITLVLEQVESLGWSLHDESHRQDLLATTAEEVLIEAYDQTVIFGFVDDVVIRVSSAEEGVRIDMRSASRIGRSDLGANAARIERFLKRLLERQAAL